MASKHNAATITFWTEEPSRITVFNGFSFVAHALPFDHYFVNPERMSDPAVQESLRSELSGYEKIFCSLTIMQHQQSIQQLIDHRWVLGGPAIITSLASGGSPAPYYYRGTLESLLGIPPSLTFTDYWTGHPTLPKKPVFFSCAVANGCYWNQCTFCDYREYNHAFSRREDVGKILSQLKYQESTCYVHLCAAACTPGLLKEVLATGQQERFILVCFCRADVPMVNFVKNYEQSLSGMFFEIGVESLSSTGMEILNKGFDFEAVFEMTKTVLEKGGTVEWSIMDNLPFLTADMAKEYETNCARAVELARSYPRLSIYNNGPVLWPTSSIASWYGAFRFLPNGRAISTIPLGSPTYDANLQAYNAINRSGIKLNGMKLGTLYE